MKTIIVLSLVAACLLGCSMLKEMSSDGQLPAVVKELPSALPFPWNLVASGVLGVVGPTRMHYGRAVSTVRYVSTILTDLLERLYGREP